MGEIKETLSKIIVNLSYDMYWGTWNIEPSYLVPPLDYLTFHEWVDENDFNVESFGDSEMIDTSWGYEFTVPLLDYIKYKSEKL